MIYRQFMDCLAMFRKRPNPHKHHFKIRRGLVFGVPFSCFSCDCGAFFEEEKMKARK